MTNSVLKPRPKPKKSINVKVSQELYSLLNSIREDAHKSGMDFNLTAIATDAFEKAAKTALKELQKAV